MIELTLFRSGMDTLEIARLQGRTEAEVYNDITHQRQQERYREVSQEYQARYYLEVTKPKRRQLIPYAGKEAS